jgi:tRNA dimethylallyltransferase
VRVICGPTAAGKSAIAATLALEYGATIISADSRQIYRGFDIGTAKPDWSERKSIQHEGIDVCDPTERYSASAWADMARQAIASDKPAIVVGGTGFYIKALFEPLFSSPALDEDARKKLDAYLTSLSTADLRAWCGELDPRRAHLGRTQLKRAIETAILTGRRISDLHDQNARESDLVANYLVIDPGNALAQRIESRVDQMIAAGWLDEVNSLSASVPDDAPAWKASGYRTMRSVAQGEVDLSWARDRIIIETRQYAKRQRTWFRHQLTGHAVTRLDPTDPEAEAIAQRWWKETS